MLPPDYPERVYADVLGKLIGVYLGRPIEGWTYDRILVELGPIAGYVHDRLGLPLVVTDDDLSGTFTFVRALADHGGRRDLTPAQIGQTWLNYLIEGRTILWWGGLGHSTEHTAYLRLRAGIEAPASGSIALNGRIIAEQIGAQIFIDGWAMVAPGDPEFAADLAKRARERKLRPEEFQGGTFTISNMGMLGIKEFASIINEPHGMIMSIGAGEKRPVVKNDALAIATIMSVTVTCDHRVVDGALGAAFLKAFKSFIEDPMAMLL